MASELTKAGRDFLAKEPAMKKLANDGMALRAWFVSTLVGHDINLVDEIVSLYRTSIQNENYELAYKILKDWQDKMTPNAPKVDQESGASEQKVVFETVDYSQVMEVQPEDLAKRVTATLEE